MEEFIPLAFKPPRFLRALVVCDDGRSLGIIKQLAELDFLVEVLFVDPLDENSLNLEEFSSRKGRVSASSYTDQYWNRDENLTGFLCLALTKDSKLNESVLSHCQNYKLRFSLTPDTPGQNMYYPTQINTEEYTLSIYPQTGDFWDLSSDTNKIISKPLLNELDQIIKCYATITSVLYEDPEEYERIIDSIPIYTEEGLPVLEPLAHHLEEIEAKSREEIKLGCVQLRGSSAESIVTDFQYELKDKISDLNTFYQIQVSEEVPDYSLISEGIEEDYTEYAYLYLYKALMERKIDIGLMFPNPNIFCKSSQIQEWPNILPRLDYNYYLVTKSNVKTINDVLKNSTPIMTKWGTDFDHLKNYLDYLSESVCFKKSSNELRNNYNSLYGWLKENENDTNSEECYLANTYNLSDYLTEREKLEKEGYHIIEIPFFSWSGEGSTLALTRKDDSFINKLLEKFSPLPKDMERSFIEQYIIDYLNTYLKHESNNFIRVNCLEKSDLYNISISLKEMKLYKETGWVKKDDLQKTVSDLLKEIIEIDSLS